MFNVLILLFVGIGLGYALRRAAIVKKVEKSVSGTVLVMLFVFGVSIGANSELVSNLGKYGVQAVVLAVAGVAGSLLASYMAYRLAFRKKKKGGGR